MAENVGGIYYDIEARTQGLIEGERAVKRSTAVISSDLNKVGASAERMNTQVTKAASGVTRGLGGVGRSAGQAGIQMQQFIGQIQGGQSAMVAFAQQSADLGFVLGVPLLGAVISIAAAIGGMLVTAMRAAGKAGKELPEELLKRLEEIKARYSEIDTESQKAFTQVELGKLSNEITGVIGKINGLKQANIELAERMKSASDARTYKLLEQQISQNERAIRKYNKEQKNLILLQEQVGQTLVTGGAEWDQINGEIDKSVDKTEQFISQLALSTVKLSEGEEAALRMAAAQALGLTNAEQLPAAVDEAIDAYIRAKDAAAEEAEFRKQLLADQKQAMDDMEAERRQRHKDELQRIDDEQKAREFKQKVAKDVRFVGVTDQQAELTRLADQYMQQQLLLQQALDLELITREDYAARKVALEQQTQEQINEINKAGTQTLKDQLDSVGISLEAFQNQAIGSFAAVASGAMSGKDAIRGLAQSILTTAIGALIKMAVVAATGQTAAATAGAATAAAIGTAYATPAALVSLASFGANAAPASAGIASTVALSQGLALGGGKLNGGPVSPGMIYPVTEDGRPELLMSGGKQYLMPGARGEVISNKDMAKAGGSSVTVNVINNASGTKIEEKRSQGPDGAQMIEIIVADIQGRGKVHGAITNTTTAGNRI